MAAQTPKFLTKKPKDQTTKGKPLFDTIKDKKTKAKKAKDKKAKELSWG